jgi:hypothetical protein
MHERIRTVASRHEDFSRIEGAVQTPLSETAVDVIYCNAESRKVQGGVGADVDGN